MVPQIATDSPEHSFGFELRAFLLQNRLPYHIYIYIYILELPWQENPANTYMWHTEHWTAVSTLLGLISSAHRDLHQQPQYAEAETLP